jgi:NAD(P)-dependent dehydrogenase (short-subunit alcohol dehydrogenase family)
MSSVLITGAGRGIGRAAALRLADRGWDVYAGVRDTGSGDRLAAEDERIKPVRLDVTEPSHLDVLADSLPRQLDAVVNNAGIGVLGPVEALALDDVRRQLEVNVTGQLAVTQAVLPTLRRSRGRIVFVSSVGGRVSIPMEGAYCASKFAIEGMADALRVELRPWGIHVSLVEPGPTDTDPWREIGDLVDGMHKAMRPDHQDLYSSHTAGMRRSTARLQGRTAPPDTVARAVERALTARRPRARYPVGADAHAMLVMRAVTPTRLQDALSARIGGWR